MACEHIRFVLTIILNEECEVIQNIKYAMNIIHKQDYYMKILHYGRLNFVNKGKLSG